MLISARHLFGVRWPATAFLQRPVSGGAAVPKRRQAVALQSLVIIVNLQLIRFEAVDGFTVAGDAVLSNHAAEHHGYWLATKTSPCFTGF